MMSYRSVVLIVAAAIAVTVGQGGEPKKKEKANKLIGTWKMVSVRTGEVMSSLSVGTVALKHVTPTQFMWARYDRTGRVYWTAGGPYKLKGDTYIEFPEYGFGGDFSKMQGNPQVFTWRIEGNKWYHKGKLSYGIEIEEVWERVEKSEPTMGIDSARPAGDARDRVLQE